MEEEAGKISETGRLPSDRRRPRRSDVLALAGIGSLLALLAIAVGLGVALIAMFERDVDDLTHRHVIYTTAMHEAALSSARLANTHRGFLVGGDVDEYLDAIRVRTTEVRSALTRADSAAVGDEQDGAVDMSRVRFELWLQALNGDTAAFRGGAREEAIAATLGATRDLRRTYEDSLARGYTLGVQSIESDTDSILTSASRSVWALLGYLAVALVIGVAIAIWVVRGILRPSLTLSRNALEVLTKGRIVVDRDETGEGQGVAVVVPIEVVNKLAGSALETQEALDPDSSVPAA